jgi:hypothetical protein
MRTNPAQLELELNALLATPAPPPTKTPEELEADLAEFVADPEAAHVSVNAYEVKQAARRDRLQRGSERARREAETAHGAATRIWGAIPMGQPILVGHHSERRHRRDLARADRAMRKSVEADKRSKALATRAAAVGSGGISSDNPEAVEKLRAQLAKLEQAQEKMKSANSAIRKYAKQGTQAQLGALLTLGFSKPRAEQLLEQDFAGRLGFANWQLTNNAANVRRIKKRIAELTSRETVAEREAITGEVEGVAYQLVENREANRVQITFEGKPSSDVRQRLKAAGFRWAPSQNAWQRQLSHGAWFHAKRALLIPDVVRTQAP